MPKYEPSGLVILSQRESRVIDEARDILKGLWTSIPPDNPTLAEKQLRARTRAVISAVDKWRHFTCVDSRIGDT